MNLNRLQEPQIVDKTDGEDGRIPRSIECELTDDLAGTVLPGDLVQVSGIVKALTIDTTIHSGSASGIGSGGGGKSNRDKCTFCLYIQGNSIVSSGDINRNTDSNQSFSHVKAKCELSDKDLEAFKAIRSEPNIFKYLLQYAN